jgi:hypothetical protein
MTEREKFDAAMKKILSVSKQELQRRLEEEKKTKTSAQGSPRTKIPIS